MNYAVIENGVVTNIAVWDGESDWQQTNALVLPVSDNVRIGWYYEKGKFSPPTQPPKTHDELLREAEAQRQSLIDAAMASISLIQLKLRAGRKLTQAETTRLNAVLDYIDAVEATDTSTAPDVIWPELPEA
ncbi:TPA: tail fiber assembly protein [Escherichia coli]|uniref:Tail fiber assembly protein n=1 Tax=Salmonella typhimurium TaxID=90371 RepID=A0A708D5W5_SALTM|nr:tail fiber assembly protein [Escherichia coli]HAD0309435.1 tail fiber assembly protein [Salmonella enterica subsp. enterica serovar Typhimurium]HBQ7523308.1 tail fiber assembly protein [Klebsiella pneumoniae]MCH0581314.1 tail fiber assembly protein [Escherichia coli]MEA0215204.1 tail fiber assembly protein [Escherichia coli]NWG99197.1 tail fiber assembly protein [Escherichia coli]